MRLLETILKACFIIRPNLRSFSDLESSWTCRNLGTNDEFSFLSLCSVSDLFQPGIHISANGSSQFRSGRLILTWNLPEWGSRTKNCGTTVMSRSHPCIYPLLPSHVVFIHMASKFPHELVKLERILQNKYLHVFWRSCPGMAYLPVVESPLLL